MPYEQAPLDASPLAVPSGNVTQAHSPASATLTRGAVALAMSSMLALGCTADPDPDDAEGPKRESKRESKFLFLDEPAATPCKGTLGAVEIEGDLIVPRDRTCRLNGTAISGRTIVSKDSSLVAHDSRFGEGISAQSFRRVDLRGGPVEGRPRTWNYDNDAEELKQPDFVFDGGRNVAVHDGPINGNYYFLGITGQVEVVGLYLDLGSVYCAENSNRPVVRGISAETPGVLRGECASNGRAFGDTDF